MSVLTIVLTSGRVQRGVMVKKTSKNTSLDILNLARVRFPSPAPLFSSANSQFFRALSYECHTKPTGSAPFSEAFPAGIETVVQGQVTFAGQAAVSQRAMRAGLEALDWASSCRMP